MQTSVAAAIVLLLVGGAHSVLGEVLIFRHLRDHGVVPKNASPPLRERHVRILWATWHVVTIFGLALAAILFHLADPSREPSLRAFAANAIVLSMATSGALVLFATRGRHPGWIGLLGVAVLAWLG
jgi:hypothetical protein